MGVEGAEKHVSLPFPREAPSESALPARRPGRPGHGVVRQPEPAREARGCRSDPDRPADRCARWRCGAGSISRPPDSARALGERYLRIRFEDLCAEPVEVTRTILDFLGLAGDPRFAVDEVRSLTFAWPLAVGRAFDRGGTRASRRGGARRARLRPLEMKRRRAATDGASGRGEARRLRPRDAPKRTSAATRLINLLGIDVRRERPASLGSGQSSWPLGEPIAERLQRSHPGEARLRLDLPVPRTPAGRKIRLSLA